MFSSAIVYVDRYLMKTRVPKTQFQLLGAASLHVACKLSGTSAITVESLACSMQKIFTLEQIKVRFGCGLYSRAATRDRLAYWAGMVLGRDVPV